VPAKTFLKGFVEVGML